MSLVFNVPKCNNVLSQQRLRLSFFAGISLLGLTWPYLGGLFGSKDLMQWEVCVTFIILASFFPGSNSSDSYSDQILCYGQSLKVPQHVDGGYFKQIEIYRIIYLIILKLS